MPPFPKDFIPYHYVPSLPAAAIFVGVFEITTLIHAYQCVRTRAFYMWPLIAGGALKVAGYIVKFIAPNEAPDCTIATCVAQAAGHLRWTCLPCGDDTHHLRPRHTCRERESRSPIRRKFLTMMFCRRRCTLPRISIQRRFDHYSERAQLRDHRQIHSNGGSSNSGHLFRHLDVSRDPLLPTTEKTTNSELKARFRTVAPISVRSIHHKYPHHGSNRVSNGRRHLRE